MNHLARTLVLTVAACALALPLPGCGDKPAPKKSASLSSRVELAAGNVGVRQPGGEWEKAIAGLLLRHGTEVKVGPGDRALIRMDDGSAVFLRHGTEVKLEAEGLRLAQGEVWVDAPQRDKHPARYRAGKVLVSAAGAGLDLRVAGGVVTVYVARGLAVVAGPGGRSEVQAGEQATIKGKGAPKISPVAFWEDWTGGMADRGLRGGSGGAGSGQIYAIDRARPGSPPRELEIRAQSVKVVVRDGVARTTVDQRFFNPGSKPLEGYYWFTVPEGAAVDRFALEVNGTLVDGEVIERKQARAAYEQAIRRAIDPALLEWINGRTFRARIFPIPPAGERRVVLSYLELLPTVDNKVHYVYPMGGATSRIQEFSLEVDLGDEGKQMKLATTADARIEGGGARVTMRRSGFQPRGDFLLELGVKRAEPLRAMRVESSRGEAAYVGLRYVPDVDWSAVKKVPGHVVVVVDTSAGGDQADRQLRSDVAEAILRALSTSDRFALMAADLTPRILYPDKGLAPADEANVGKALERLSGVARGGATDLGGVFDVALKRLHGAPQPGVVYIGDGLPTVGELEGGKLAGRVARSMADSPARLFTIAVGASCNHALLERLARIGGGRALRVDLARQAVQEALSFVGALKTPTITELQLDVGAGLDQVFSTAAGKISRGQEVALFARSHHPLPDTIEVSGRLGGKPFTKTYETRVGTGRKYAYLPKLWARRYLTRLLSSDRQRNRGTIIRLGVDYSLMTPFSSFLVLESMGAYGRWGVKRRPRDPLWGIVPHAALEAAAGLPLALFGCSRKSASESPAVQSEQTQVASSPAPATVQASEGTGELAAPPAPGAGASLRRRKGHRSPGMARLRRARPAKEEAPADRVKKKTAAAGPDVVDEPAEGGEQRDKDAATRQVVVLRVCSDAARRPLADRRALWRQRLRRATDARGWLRIYRRAAARCELPHWRDRKALLDLVQRRVHTPAQVRVLLGAIRDRKGRDFVRRRLLGRAVTPAMSAALTGADPVNWAIVEGTLPSLEQDPARRVEQLRALCRDNPGSSGCMWRLVRALVAAKQHGEALSVALKMRDDGLATPELMQEIGDLLAAAGRAAEARRVYSEIVEFSPDNPDARRLLGDICLRHGWYEAAYRQYRTLSDARPNHPLSLLRMAAAAAGTGRVDEALRQERKVASGEGEPGPGDPRRFARLWSAARIARLMLSPRAKKESMRQSMERSLRRLQVVPSPGYLVLVTWEDLSQRLQLQLAAGEQKLPWADQIDAHETGLLSVATRVRDVDALTATLSAPEGLRRPLPVELTVIKWDGKRMRITTARRVIKTAAATRVALELP